MCSAKEAGNPSVSSELQTLSFSATALNRATLRLSKSIEVLDDALRKLNLGIACWVNIATGSNEDGTHSITENLGYDKINGKWGLALASVTEDEFGGEPEANTWLFCDASREFRIRAVTHLPKLIAQMNRNASAVTAKVSESADQAEAIAEAINSLSSNGPTAPDLGEIKRYIVKALTDARSQTTAADAIEDAALSFDGDTLTIKTELTKIMLPMVINNRAEMIIRDAIAEKIAYTAKVVLLPRDSKSSAKGGRA
jgi:hypothetical protein